MDAIARGFLPSEIAGSNEGDSFDTPAPEEDVGQRIIEAAMERFGRVDTVVNNAGIFIPRVSPTTPTRTTTPSTE